MCEKDSNAKRRDRVGMDMSPDSAKVLRSWAYTHFVHVRDVPVHMADKLSASEEARRLAEQSAHNWRMEIERSNGILSEQADLIDALQNAASKWKAECERRRAMTALEHIGAAWAKQPLIAGLVAGVPIALGFVLIVKIQLMGW